MNHRQDLAARHPDVRFVRMAPGEHGRGAVWKITPKGADSPVMYARTDEQADRYAETLTRLPQP
ncbi:MULTISPECIES: hypothetical protein [Nocardiopsis]|uniref:Uncharacterized protein n=1 Tax=Nocardiopsis sinuspersici TaxID=501010 RepID=A0A1V3C3Z2_9ACTN|nr:MULTISPECIES: hypothetical protein [Nocardiopsis]NYH51952.1 hypothetical protein [Nocardiopsis sinuspersici]OOC55514.1 hypothetical protein NOSIN_18225 [Nocardiopsis sinuspersici]